MFNLFQCTINIVFDRVGKKDPVTRGIEIAVHWMGFDIDVIFWSQHVSFFLIGCIVVTSIRGLLLTLTKVRNNISVYLENSVEYRDVVYNLIFLFLVLLQSVIQ